MIRIGPCRPQCFSITGQMELANSREKEATFARKIRRAGLIRDHQIWTLSDGIRTYNDSFRGDDFVQWLMRDQSFSRAEALNKGQSLLDQQLIDPIMHLQGGISSPLTPFSSSMVDESTRMLKEMGRSFSTDRYYKLMTDQQQESPKIPLNGGEEGKEAVVERPRISIREFNDQLCAIVGRIYAIVLSENRRLVHLERLDECEPFSDYLQLASQAAQLDIAGGSEQERLAVFINLHNIMLLHITHKYGLPATIWQRRKYLYSTYYDIGGHLYSLQSIFNGILRGNRKGLGMLWKPFGDKDARNQFVIRGGEPLVHFGLNNYTRSCPPINVYTVENIYGELLANARKCLVSKEFLQIDIKKNHVFMAKFFKQYPEEFGSKTDDILIWLCRVLDPMCEERAQLAKILCTRSYDLTYLPMDADLNVTYGVNNLLGEDLAANESRFSKVDMCGLEGEDE